MGNLTEVNLWEDLEPDTLEEQFPHYRNWMALVYAIQSGENAKKALAACMITVDGDLQEYATPEEVWRGFWEENVTTMNDSGLQRRIDRYKLKKILYDYKCLAEFLHKNYPEVARHFLKEIS